MTVSLKGKLKFKLILIRKALICRRLSHLVLRNLMTSFRHLSVTICVKSAKMIIAVLIKWNLIKNFRNGKAKTVKSICFGVKTRWIVFVTLLVMKLYEERLERRLRLLNWFLPDFFYLSGFLKRENSMIRRIQMALINKINKTLPK